MYIYTHANRHQATTSVQMSILSSMFLSSRSVTNHQSPTGLFAQDNCISASEKSRSNATLKPSPSTLEPTRSSQHIENHQESSIHNMFSCFSTLDGCAASTPMLRPRALPLLHFWKIAGFLARGASTLASALFGGSLVPSAFLQQISKLTQLGGKKETSLRVHWEGEGTNI